MFTIYKGGYYSKHSSDFCMNRPNGLPYYLLLIIKSCAVVNINGAIQNCKPDSVLIVKPNTPYSYKNPTGVYIDDYLHFDCSEEGLSLFEEQMFHHCFQVGNAKFLTTYVQQLLHENSFASADSKQYYVDTLFKVLIRHIREDFEQQNTIEQNPYLFKLQNLRLEIQAAPYRDYSAKDVAAGLGISASYFQYLYKKLFNITFHADIINFRIDYAKELILSTDMPLEQIAYSCGYSNEVHFYRQFLSKTGITPGEYRRTYST